MTSPKVNLYDFCIIDTVHEYCYMKMRMGLLMPMCLYIFMYSNCMCDYVYYYKSCFCDVTYIHT
jgi:hypothetical protein